MYKNNNTSYSKNKVRNNSKQPKKIDYGLSLNEVEFLGEYQLLDCGEGLKLEKFGNIVTIKPCPQALWPKQSPEAWNQANLEFNRLEGERGRWEGEHPKAWVVQSKDGYKWYVEPNEFGNIGVFTEHWEYAPSLENFFKPKASVLNLFTYSGSNCINLMKNGFKVTAVDSSRSAFSSLTKNMELNDIPKNNCRLILEDAYKFIAREERRASKYDAVMIDAPSFGRGTKGEVFKIEEHLMQILNTCKNLLTSDGKLVLTLHSPRFTPAMLEIMLAKLFNKPSKVTEILPTAASGIHLPSGILGLVG